MNTPSARNLCCQCSSACETTSALHTYRMSRRRHILFPLARQMWGWTLLLTLYFPPGKVLYITALQTCICVETHACMQDDLSFVCTCMYIRVSIQQAHDPACRSSYPHEWLESLHHLSLPSFLYIYDWDSGTVLMSATQSSFFKVNHTSVGNDAMTFSRGLSFAFLPHLVVECGRSH